MATKTEAASGLTQFKLLEMFSYDQATGVLTWAYNPCPRRKRCGLPAGRLHHLGYVKVKIKGFEYSAHRLIWMMMTGEWPAHEVDHIDHDRGNNRWVNLRAATRSQNARNASRRKNNKSGIIGVCYSPANKRWIGSIVAGAGPVAVDFKTKEEAVSWRKSQEKIHYGEFATQAAA